MGEAKRYAIVDKATGIVVMAVVWDGKLFDPATKTGWSPPDGCEAYPSERANPDDVWSLKK